MNATGTDQSSIFGGAKHCGRNSLYALGIALVLGVLISLGFAGQAKGAPGPDPCTTDSTSYGVNAGGGRILGPEGIFCRDTADMPSKYGNTAEAGNRTFNIKPVVSGGPAIDMSHPSIPEGTPEALFRTERWDPGVLGGARTEEMSFDFPVTSGTYEVRLYFAEIWSNSNNPTGATCCQGENQRVFDVDIEGTELDNYDVFKKAGGGFKGIVETRTVTANDGTLNIDFTRVEGKNNPAVKAIEVLDAAEPGNKAPVIENVSSPQSATEGEDFSLDLQASDADNDPITYSVKGLPNGLTFNPTTGDISGKPAAGSSAQSPYLVQAEASDGTDTGSESFQLMVSKGDTADPTISRLKPSGKTRDRTPRISAVVRDAGSELEKSDIKLYVDKKARAFSYNADTDRLSAVSRRLSYGKHAVKVVATDGSDNTAQDTSRFKVVKKRR